MLGFSGRAEVALIAMLCFRSAQAFLMPIAPAAASVCVTKGHLRRVQPLYRSSRVPGVMMASRFTDDQVKAKEAAGPSDPLLELDPSTKDGKVFKTVILKAGRLAKALKKPSGSISVVGELKRRDPDYPDSQFPIPDVFEASEGLYTAKAHAVGVWTDPALFGFGMEDLRTAVVAQQGRKGSFPGPCPVLACDLMLSEPQLAAAAQAGAAGALLSAGVLGDRLPAMVAAAAASALDAVVLCESAAELQAAAAAGARLLAIDTRRSGVEAGLALAREAKEVGVAWDVLVAAGGVADITDAWKLRDGGFGCVMIGEMLLTAAYGKEGEVRQGGGKEGVGAAVIQTDKLKQDDLNALVRGLTVKASVKYGPTSAAAFKEKGAKFKKHYEV